MRNFLKQTFTSTLGTLLGLLIFSGLGIGGMLLLLITVASRDTGPQVKDKSVLVYDLSLNITDSRSSSDASSIIQETIAGESRNSVSLRTVLDTLEKARRDDRIVGIYLDGSRRSQAGGNGFATLKEVRQSLERFGREKGKTIVAYNNDWREREYYLGSVANTIVLNPLGEIEVKGLSSQPLFLAGALQKYGIGVQVIRVGKFKAAVEPFLLTKMSPENRQQTRQLLGDVWGEWRSAVGKSRNVNQEQLQEIADAQPVLPASDALKRGLVDKVAYLDEVIEQLKKLTGNDDKDNQTFRQISLTRYAEVSGKSLGMERDSKNQIAVIYAEGEIVDGQGDTGEIGGDRFAKIFRELRQDKDIKAVVLRINSPGGSATAAEVIQREVRLTHKVKPVVVSMGNVAASGGYWIATDASRIFAEPNTITGSIGVFGLLLNVQELANKNGLTWDVVKTGRYADSQTISRPKSPQELELYQRSVNRIYDLFLNKVAQGRNLPEQQVELLAQGRVWSGIAAKQRGLVDEIGGIDAAIGYAAKQAKLGNDWELQEYPKSRTLEERLLGRITGEVARVLVSNSASDQTKLPAPLTAEFQKFQDEMAILQTLNDPLGVYARLPFNLRIE